MKISASHATAATNADENETPEKEQLRQRGRKTRRTRRKRIQQNRKRQHAPPSEQIGQIATEQTKHPTRERRYKKQRARPTHIHFASGRPQRRRLGALHPTGHERFHQRRTERSHRRLNDQREHQQLVNVEREPNGRDNTDQPGGARKSRSTCRSGGISGSHSEVKGCREKTHHIKRRFDFSLFDFSQFTFSLFVISRLLDAESDPSNFRPVSPSAPLGPRPRRFPFLALLT